MKVLCTPTALFVLAAALGCHKDDPNKDLKPIDPNATPPKMVNEGGPGNAKGPAEKSPRIMQ